MAKNSMTNTKRLLSPKTLTLMAVVVITTAVAHGTIYLVRKCIK